MKIAALLLVVLSLAGCTDYPHADLMDVIAEASRRAPLPVPGEFEFEVQNTGMDNGWLYLNSERDYRDPRNVSIALSPDQQDALSRRFSADLPSYFKGKRVLADGVAKRVRIEFFCGEASSIGYYYQTHIRVAEPQDVRLLD
jgi:hypothetical protein